MNSITVITTTLGWIVQGFFFGIGIIAATDLWAWAKPKIRGMYAKTNS
ncbi:MAG: hypothetical protein Q7K57_12730 [Burkholderiaceae bacterium]|nr:hypothetical protein [Burkholderiaceae bacterium]